MARGPSRLWIAAGLAALIVATPANAQVMITPVAGGFVPTSNLYEEQGTLTTARQSTAFAFGIRALLSASGLIGIEGSILYVPSDLNITTSSTGEVSRSAESWYGSVRGILVLNSVYAPANIYFAAGVGIVSRRGEAFSGATGATDVTGNLGLGALFRLSSSLRIRLEIEDYLYTARFAFPDIGETIDRFQNDLIFTAGLSIPL